MADVQLLAPPADIPALNSKDPASSELADSSAETHLNQTGSYSDPLRPAICYDRRLLLHLSKSSLIEPPKDMPAFTDWFGFRRDGDETGDLPAREPSSRPARPAFSQPSQMGSFRHQSTIQSLKLDSSTADKDGHERLRNLSDRFDRDRLRSMSGDQSLAGLPQAANRRDRDAAPLNPSHRQGSSGSLSANPTGRRDTRASDREPIRPNGATRSAIHERSSTLTSKEISETRNDRSDDWRRADRWDDRDRPPRERHAETKDRSRERGWERSRSREPRDRRGGWDVYGEKDKDPWYRTSGGRDDDRRKEDEAPIVPLRSTRRERGAERDRERDKEPAWMDDWPDSAPSGTGKGLVLGAVNGEDKLQAWKKSMKEKDTPAAESPAQEASSPPDGLQDGLNDIERFKLQMKQAQAQETNAPTPPTAPLANGAPPGLNGLPSDPAIVSAPPPTFVADPAIVSASTPGSAVPSPSPHPVGSGADGFKSLGLPSAAQTPSGNSTPNPNPDSVSLFQTLFNQNPPPQSTPPSAFPQETPPNLTPIDVKPTAQNVFASFLNESRHPPKSNGISSNTSSVIRSPDIDPPLSSAASATSTSSRTTVPPGNLPLLSGAGAGGRTSKFAKFFSQQPPTPKDESGPSMGGLGSGLPLPNGPTNPLLSHQSQPSLGGRDPMSMNLGNMGLPPLNGSISGLPNGVGNGMGHPNGMMGLGGPGGMGMGGRIASPTQHGHFAVQQQQQQPQMINAPPRLGGGTTTPDALAGLFANAERGMGQLNNPAAPTGGTMEGLLAALDASARGQPPSRGSSRFPQQPMNKPGGGPFGMLPGQQPSGLPQFSPQGGLPPMAQHQQAMFSSNGLGDTADRFVADNLVPGLRPQPQRPRESSLSLGAGGLYGPDMEAERDQLARQFQNLHMGGVNGAGMPPLGPPLHQQQLFEQRQQLARQQQQQQTLYANQGQNQNRNVLAGMMGVGNGVVPGMGRPTPSPIGNQNPALMQQRGQPQQQQQPRDLNISLMNLGLGGGMRTPQDLVGAGLGQPRTPQELAHAGLLRGAGGVDLFGGNQQQGQFGGQQGRLANLGNFGALGPAGANPQGGPATGPLNVPNVGAPGTADYALHSQQLQAARASAAAQQQAQMMQHLGIGLGGAGAGRGGLPGPPQGQQGQQQRMPGQQQQMMGAGPLDAFLGAGGPANVHMHANHPGGPPSHLPQGNAEQFLQLFLGANAGRGE
ncbi:hypothetical protein FRC04_009489 [Tulasnella sp. 424]|nr:hypothetical protein FRC04_009489 [Tulasnella sp. 424]KAG8971210.1 hypothetical protein FRC05_011404 [Tulasnella sp. 425]